MPDKPSLPSLNRRHRLAVAFVLLVAASACSSGPGIEMSEDSAADSEIQEESGAELAPNEKYDHIRGDAHLTLAYVEKSNSFDGTVCNTIESVLKRVRVEVHLSNGVELGPTTPADLDPGECIDVSLEATSNEFDRWSAHPEVGESGTGEHSGAGEEGEHGEEGEGGSD
jgi:hypothetical protein